MAILTGDKATEAREGVIRVATDAEASAGTLEDVAVNPKQLVQNAIGALEYKGTYSATANNPDLSGSLKGDFYKVNEAGTLAGISLSIGDHIVFNRDASDPLVSADFDKIDSTESVTGLNDLTDVSFTAGEAIDNYVLTYNHAQNRWEAEEATGGGASSLNDLSDVTIVGASTGEVLRHNGTNFVDAQLAYSDLSGTPTIPSSSDDITSDHTGQNYTGALDANITAHLSGIDTALASAGASSLDDLSDVTIGTASTGEVLRYNGTNFVDAQLAYSDLSGTPTIPSSSDDITSDHTGVNYTGANTDSITTHLSGIDTALASAGASSLDDLSDVTIGTASTGEVLRYNGTNFVDAQLAYSDLSGTPTIPSSSDDITSDHTGVNYTGANTDSITTHLSGIDTALASATTDAEGRIEIATNAEAGAGTATDKALVPSNIGSIELNQLKFVSYTAGQSIDNYALTYDHNTTSWGAEKALLASQNLFDVENKIQARLNMGLAINQNVQGYDPQLTDIAGLTPTDGGFIVGDGSNFVIETLGTARNSLGLGTSATLDAGQNTANQLVQLDANGKLPAVDGSQLTNISGGGGSRPDVSDITTTPNTISDSTNVEDVFLCKSNASVVTLPTAIGNEGYKIHIKNTLSSAITVNAPNPGTQQTIDGSNSVSITSQHECLTFISDGADWFII